MFKETIAFQQPARLMDRQLEIHCSKGGNYPEGGFYSRFVLRNGTSPPG
jgi:hypothetical protein